MFVPNGSNFDVAVYNAVGELVHREHSFDENYTLNNEILSEGMYFIHIIKDGEVNKIKLIVTK